MKISYCISAYNRAKQLDNTLHAFAKQDLAKKDYEIIVVDDNSEEDLRTVCLKYKGKMNLRYIRLEHDFGSRDCATALNFAMRRAKGDVWACSHPEVLLSKSGLDVLYSSHYGKYPLVFQQENKDLDNLCVLLPTIKMAEDQFSLWEYDHLTFDKIVEKYQPGVIALMPNIRGASCFVCMSMKKETWIKMGGFYEFYSWGSVDPDNQSRRDVFGIADVIAATPHGLCIHQYHPVSPQAQLGQAQLEIRPFGEASMPLANLSQLIEDKRSNELKEDIYFPI